MREHLARKTHNYQRSYSSGSVVSRQSLVCIVEQDIITGRGRKNVVGQSNEPLRSPTNDGGLGSRVTYTVRQSFARRLREGATSMFHDI